MRLLLSSLGLLASTIALPAQVNNYGLSIQGGGQFAGRSCNSASCQSSALRMSAGTPVTVTVYGTPQSFYAVAVGAPANQCRRIPGIANEIMLQPPVETLSIGILNMPVGPSICLAIQETASFNATIPASAAGLTFRLQALTVGGVGASVGPVFTESIDLSVF